MPTSTKSQGLRWAMLIVLLAVASLIYLPGLTGPFVFDDHSNLTSNVYIKITSLDWDSLSQAAYSLNAGPLQRPVAMLSFAINYYAAGGFDSTFSYKLTNLVLHVVNGILIFALARAILARLIIVQTANRAYQKSAADWLLPFIVALLWFVHPIQLTSVLYVVQRMTELSALFLLLGLLAYINARLQLNIGRARSAIAWISISLTVFWPLALLSKETALLMPCFVAVFEFILFPTETPWSRWANLKKATRTWITVVTLLALAAALAASIAYALPKYDARSFTMGERVMTEARVMFFYISLLLIPRVDAFGLHHDDLAISTSLLSPWTTLPAIMGILMLTIFVWFGRRKYPWFSFGFGWFLVGHLLESTIFPLEIAHEHRNYLPSFGVLFALVFALFYAFEIKRPTLKYTIIGIVTAGFAGITAIRASQWSDDEVLYFFEAKHHPKSASALAAYSNVLLAQGQFEKSLETIRRAGELSSDEAGFLISAQVVRAVHGTTLEPSEHSEILDRLRKWPPTATTVWALDGANDCIMDRCKRLQKQMEEWLNTLLQNPNAKDPALYYFYLGRNLFSQGRVNDAVDAYRRSYELDPNYFHPLFDLADLYLTLKRPAFAQAILAEARRVNSRSAHKRERELQRLEERIAEQLARERKG